MADTSKAPSSTTPEEKLDLATEEGVYAYLAKTVRDRQYRPFVGGNGQLCVSLVLALTIRRSRDACV